MERWYYLCGENKGDDLRLDFVFINTGLKNGIKTKIEKISRI